MGRVGDTFLPAPADGINVSDPISALSNRQGLILSNLVPGKYGPKVRKGHREWSTTVPYNAGGGQGVRTVIPFMGATSSEDKLFAASSSGIYDCTAGGSGPALAQAFASNTADTGYCSHLNFVTIAGRFLLVCDEVNGYYVRDTTPTWNKVAMGAGATQINGVDPATFCFVALWKSRLWFVKKDTAEAWYLPVGQIYGTATKFDFGNKFPNGGTLKAIYSWTRDGGSGPDDFLVALSSTGDVIIYQGTDPAAVSTFDQKGSWNVGGFPKGRRLASSSGGDLMLLTVGGVMSAAALASGNAAAPSPSYYISPLITDLMEDVQNSYGWEIQLIPKQGLSLVATPKQDLYDHIQFAYHTLRGGWGAYASVPYHTGDSWRNEFYIGTSDNRVLWHTGDVDGVTLAGAGSTPITYKCLTRFDYLGNVKNKQVSIVTPRILSKSPLNFVCEVRYDFNINDLLGAVSGTVAETGIWGTSLWGSAVWGGGWVRAQPSYGAAGYGKSVAVGLVGKSTAETVLVGFEIIYEEGGPL